MRRVPEIDLLRGGWPSVGSLRQGVDGRRETTEPSVLRRLPTSTEWSTCEVGLHSVRTRLSSPHPWNRSTNRRIG